jgi:hypothetical protein
MFTPASERPHIQNDTITINHRFANDHIIKLSISHALSQVRPLQHAGGTPHLQPISCACADTGAHLWRSDIGPCAETNWCRMHAEHEAVRL